jgi:hypothetical protein
MTSGTVGESVTVELCVRSLTPSGMQAHQERIVSDLRRLEASGVIEEFDVTVWGRKLVLGSSTMRLPAAEGVLDRYRRFREWASANGRSVGKLFEVKRVESSLAGEEYHVLVLPTMMLAEYHGDRLHRVTPTLGDGETTTVVDRVEGLERDTEPEVSTTRPPSTSTSSSG